MAKRTLISKADLLKPKTHQVEIDGGYVTIRALTAAYAVALRGKTMDDAAVFDLIAKSVVEPEMTPEEAGQLDVTTMNQIVNGILEFNGIGPDAIEKAKADLKNSQAEGSTKS